MEVHSLDWFTFKANDQFPLLNSTFKSHDRSNSKGWQKLLVGTDFFIYLYHLALVSLAKESVVDSQDRVINTWTDIIDCDCFVN